MNNTNFGDFKLSDEIRNAIHSLEYELPTEVQGKVIPLLLEQHDLVVKSQTGSGKTASYGIPICELIDWLENKPQALILTPTRELAIQVKEDITNIGRWKRIKAMAVYGKQPINVQKTELKQKTHVVVGTPGRIIDHLERNTLQVNKIRFLVIDEADEMLNMGFIEQVETIIKKLPKERVTLLFSATLPKPVKNIALNYMIEPIDIEIMAKGITAEQINHYVYKITEKDKNALLKDVTVMENPDSCIVFCRTKDKVDMVYDKLTEEGYLCDRIHGGMEQDDRIKAMNAFKRGEYRYLIATDVAARGIDIESVSLVINYDIPFKKESYVHRTGRTGRAGQSGKAITFVTPMEERFLNEIEEFIGFEIPVIDRPLTEAVTKQKATFDLKMKEELVIKKSKSEALDHHIMKIHFNGGKNKKLRATNFVGVIANIEGITAEDIGIITVLDSLTYVEILNGKGPIVLDVMRNTAIGGKLLKVSEAAKR